MSPEAEELVQAGRAALRPSSADRERVLQALLTQVGGSPGAGQGTGGSTALASAKASIVKTLLVLVGLGVAGGGAFLALRPASRPARPVAVAPAPTLQSAQQVTAPRVAVPPETAAAPGKPLVVAPRIEIARRPAPAASPADSLAQEVAILSRAGSELHSGRPDAALVALAEHQRKFPAGALTEERTAARIQALCALGRMKEATADLQRLARMSPGSPHEARARKACGLAPTNRE